MKNIKNKSSEENQKSFLIKTQRGFTLLEIMLVIVIMATITVFSIGIFQQQAVNAQISRTALQMQQWLEAAKAYYVDNNAWPDGTKFTGQGTGLSCVKENDEFATQLLLEGKCGPLAENNKIYIQAGPSIENNAWGQPFKLEPPSQNSAQPSSVFQVRTTVPTDVNNAFVIPQRLASLLPNATVNTLQNSVVAGVTVPGSASNDTGNVIIKAIKAYNCDNSAAICATVAKPVCPANMVPNIYLSLQGFDPTVPPYKSMIGDIHTDAIENKDNWQVELVVNGAQQIFHQGSVVAVLTCEASKPNEQTASNIYAY